MLRKRGDDPAVCVDNVFSYDSDSQREEKSETYTFSMDLSDYLNGLF